MTNNADRKKCRDVVIFFLLACSVRFEVAPFWRAVGVNPLFLAWSEEEIETGDSRPPLAWIRCFEISDGLFLQLQRELWSA